MTPRQRDIVKYKVLKTLAQNPQASQRELAKVLGVSLGSVNFCLKALIEKGQIKVENFSKSSDKKGYMYLLTPAGLVEKAELTAQFLMRKKAEYAMLKEEIAQLEQDLQNERRHAG